MGWDSRVAFLIDHAQQEKIDGQAQTITLVRILQVSIFDKPPRREKCIYATVLSASCCAQEYGECAVNAVNVYGNLYSARLFLCVNRQGDGDHRRPV